MELVELFTSAVFGFYPHLRVGQIVVSQNQQHLRGKKAGRTFVRPACNAIVSDLRLAQNVKLLRVGRRIWIGELIVARTGGIFNGCADDGPTGDRRADVVCRQNREVQSGRVGECKLHGGGRAGTDEMRRAGRDGQRRDDGRRQDAGGAEAQVVNRLALLAAGTVELLPDEPERGVCRPRTYREICHGEAHLIA